MSNRSLPLLLLPIVGIWRVIWGILGFILKLTGRFVAIILGVIFLIVGAVLTISIVGAIIGIPLIVFGILLIIRGLF